MHAEQLLLIEYGCNEITGHIDRMQTPMDQGIRQLGQRASQRPIVN
jgi:hypothetical protein